MSLVVGDQRRFFVSELSPNPKLLRRLKKSRLAKMVKILVPIVLALFVRLSVFAQDANAVPAPGPAPKLIVGIVVDQMRYDFIYRFWERYGEGGFKRLIHQGAFYRNAEYNYVPTFTGPGHASIFTGATPSGHGIVGNDWYDRTLGKTVYCVADADCAPVGADNARDGRMSPRRLLATTITDELKLSDNMRSKVIGVSLKDRAAILPAGHLADGAYWFDDGTGRWITSTYYMKVLPAWVANFNSSNRAEIYLEQTWTNLADYTEGLTNGNEFERKLTPNETHAGFPHHLPPLFAAERANRYGLIRFTPFGNSLTEDFAEAAIRGENLGRNGPADFLTLNFASTDYAGHKFGPRSMEVEDVYVRLDQTLAGFLNFLDASVGKTNVIVFLTADHGVADVPEYSKANRLPGGIFHWRQARTNLTGRLQGKYGSSLIQSYTNQQIYLDNKTIASQKLDKAEVERDIRDWLLLEEGVADVVSSRDVKKEAASNALLADVANGIYPSRSGDLTLLLQSGWIEEEDALTATTHGTPYQYDTHVPVLFWGWRIPNMICDEPVTITEITPTLCQLLNIQFPSASANQILPGLCK
jgi:predicted AlkP superfamily pyrophosphatase or phosphodiesterase